MTYTMILGAVGGALGVLIAVLLISNPASDVGTFLAMGLGGGGTLLGATLGAEIDLRRS